MINLEKIKEFLSKFKIKPKIKEIYCRNCRYFIYRKTKKDKPGIQPTCLSKINIKKIPKPFEPRYETINSPEKLNELNICFRFRPNYWIFGIIYFFMRVNRYYKISKK